MTGKNVKALKKLKKSYAWSGMLVTLFLSIVMVVTLAILTSAALQYVLESWISAEYDRISYMAHMYDSGMTEELKRLDREDRAYVVIDDDRMVYAYGKNTCSGIGHPIKVISDGGFLDIVVYHDTESQLFSIDEDTLTLDMGSFMPNILNPDMVIGINAPDTFKLPLWIGVKTVDGSIFAGRSTLDIDKNDLMFLGVVAGVLAGVFMLVFIFMLIRLILGIRNRRRLTKLVFGDEATGGNNWIYFRMKGEQILRRRSNARNHYAVLDIVFFKYRNYCVCHSVAEGEKQLATVRQVIEMWLGRGELSAHYASAHFVALVKADSNEKLQNRLNDLLGQLSCVDPAHNISFHIGVAYLDACSEHHNNASHDCPIDLERDYNNACAARATLDETDGSAIAYFTDEMVEEQIWEDRVRERQMTALLNEEFVVYYQPKYNPADDKLTGAEALIRWQSPEFGFVPPGRIIPIFEKNGFITEIDHYMIRHVARDQKRWYDTGYKCVPVSVNVSRAHFVEEDLAEQIRDIVDSEGAPHELIELELTESAFFDDKKALVSTINKLKSYGFAVSMDDFGSGYSSLNSLKDLPLDVLKLDADFFRGDSDVDRSEIVISETIRLAQALHMRTVAEGVEVKEQVDFLAQQGCDMIQGYYYAKPMPGNEFEQRMNAG
ncbi:MAG: GGDEF domain-containing protein [Lachnospiraceae bacterium]|nr:GGDEF domain-containing protein [Lachnospiraceae bacterium]